MDLLMLVGGLALLTVAADRFVLGSARLSTALRVSPVLIGAVVIGFGTSTPELVVSLLAAVQESADLAFGNLVGSNTANVLLVLGSAALLQPVAVTNATLRRELPLMLAGATLFAAVTVGGHVSLVEASGLLVAAAAALTMIVLVAHRDREAADALAAEVAEYETGAPARLPASVLLVVVGLVGVLAGAQLLVHGAVGLARALGMSEAAIGLTIVAVGTSLPELVSALAAARRQETDLVVGNVLGSNLFNSLPVAGVAGMAGGARLDPAFTVSLAVMLSACALAAVFLRTGRRLGRREAAVMLAFFLVATVLAL